MVQKRNLQTHMHMFLYAEDTQVYGFCRPSGVHALQDDVSALHHRCFGVDEVKPAAAQYSTKTEVLW